ncbi:hypothetical protein AMTRI_Chr11g150890 [Amborella trichopoda]
MTTVPYASSFSKRMAPTVDRISSLSNDILHHILDFMPIREAGRTSVLSKRWKDVWASTPCLNIFETEMDPIDRSKYEWPAVVDKALLLHKETIHGFKLHEPVHPDGHIDGWLRSLCGRGLQDLTIEFFPLHEDNEAERYKIPSFVFACSSLVSLDLTCCVLRLPSGFKGFKSLKFLSLDRVSLHDTILESLVSGSSHLEHLNIEECNGLSKIKIQAPSLLYLHIFGDFRNINLNRCNNMKRLSIHLSENSYRNNDPGRRLGEYLKGLVRLQSLYLHGWSLWYLFKANVPQRLPLINRNLRVLDILIDLWEEKDVFAFVCLLKSYPCLEVLAIEAYDDTNRGTEIIGDYWKMLEHSGPWLGCLRNVGIKNITGSEHEIQLIGFFLANTRELENFYVYIEEGIEHKRRFKIAKLLHKFPRSSNRAKVHIS